MKLVKLAFGLLFFLCLGLSLLVYNVGPIVKSGVEKVGPSITETPVSIGNIDVNWLDTGITINDFLIGNPEGYAKEQMFTLGLVTVQLDTASLLTDEIHIKSIVIDSPIINYEKKLAESNFSRLLASIQSHLPQKESTEPASGQQQGGKVIIDYLKITGGGVNVSTGLVQGAEKHISLDTIELHDIGKDEGNSMASAVEKILLKIQQAVLPNFSESMFNQEGNGLDTTQLEAQLKDVTEKAKEGADSGMENAKETLDKGFGQLQELFK